jgi:hypothetical protein
MMSGAGGMIMQIGAAAMAAYSADQQAKAQARQAKAEAAWHDYNARVAQREAEAERKAAEYEAQQHKRQADQVLKRHRALVGVSGVTSEGSPLLVEEDTAAQLALENAMIREQGLRRTGSYISQSILDFAKSSYASKSAKGYARAGKIRAGASLLGSGSKAYYQYQGS